MFFKILILLFSTILASSVSAANWIAIGGNEKLETFIDTESVVKTGDKRKVWVKFSHTEPQKIQYTYPTKTYTTSKNLYIYNCKNRTSTTTQYVR